jgi:hypothetical protein
MLTKIYENHISPIFLLFKILGCYSTGHESFPRMALVLLRIVLKLLWSAAHAMLGIKIGVGSRVVGIDARSQNRL